jgi:hypothetical protein
VDIGIIITLVSVLFGLAITAVTGFIMWKVFSGVMKGAQQQQQLLAMGHPANGRILQLLDTGTWINNNPQVRIIVEVHPPGRAPYQAECTMVVSQLAIPRVQPGSAVHVRFDPMNPARIALAV